MLQRILKIIWIMNVCKENTKNLDKLLTNIWKPNEESSENNAPDGRNIYTQWITVSLPTILAYFQTHLSPLEKKPAFLYATSWNNILLFMSWFSSFTVGNRKVVIEENTRGIFI